VAVRFSKKEKAAFKKSRFFFLIKLVPKSRKNRGHHTYLRPKRLDTSLHPGRIQSTIFGFCNGKLDKALKTC
jgi:hypothetical protein